MKTQNYVITGMTCANCVLTVTKAIEKSPKVVSATVNLATEKAKVVMDDEASDDEILKLVADSGYGAIINDKKHQEEILEKQRKDTKKQKQNLMIAAILTTPILAAMIENFFGTHYLGIFHNEWLQWILATPVQFWIGARFYSGAYHSLRGGTANMDVLVSLGTSVAYLSSLILGIGLGQRDALNFESSMVIVTLVLAGKVMEHSAKEKTTHAITKLMATRVSVVHCLDQGDKATEEIKVGEPIRILPGEKVPLDVEIVRGTASFDESALTGESLPVTKKVGDSLFEGAIVLDGEIIARVTHAAADSMISRMVEMMSDAQARKPHIQALADKISGIFVPVVLSIAVLTFILQLAATHVLLSALMPAVAVLVIACPCALGLATPTAIVSGTGLAAKQGLLIRDANALEATHDVKTVFFDKTGTITTGDFELTEFSGEAQEWQILVSLESHSNHPLAQSVVQAKNKINTEVSQTEDATSPTPFLSVEEVMELSGRGLSGLINGVKYYAGNKKLMEEISVSVPETTDTVIYLAVNGELLATATFASEVKPLAKETLSALSERGIQTVMLTGDNEISAKKIQYQVAMSEVRAGLSPEEKAQMIEATAHAMMVGDGINDAVALAEASVGVAMATGSDIAMEAGAVTVLGGKIEKILALFEVSRKTMIKVRQNYFWAFIYNIIGIPLAAFGVLNPMFAAACMALSSVSVILNSLLLTRASIKTL